jgi:hypothetical protein
MTDVRHLTGNYSRKHAARLREVADVAAAQHGVVARRQLDAAGFAAWTIEHQLETGRLHRVHRGVYALGHMRLTPRGRWMAAVLACGDGAVLSHQSAFSLQGLPIPAPLKIHVTVTGFARRHRGVHVHRVRWLAPADRSIFDGIPVTTVARALLDLAEVLSVAQLRRALAEAVRLRRVDVNELWALCARSPGRRGLRPLVALLSEFSPPPRIRSGLERLFKSLWARSGLDQPLFNAVVGGYEVDVLFPDERLIVELDTYTYHGMPPDFEADRERDAKLMMLGYRVLRVTDRQLEDDPDRAIATIRDLLGRGARPPAGGRSGRRSPSGGGPVVKC